MERKLRKFLLVVLVPKKEPEHETIKRAVEHHSEGDFQLAFLQAGKKPDVPFVIGYLFTSEADPRNMGFGLLNQDSFLLVELGDHYAEAQLSVAASWLRRHQPRR